MSSMSEANLEKKFQTVSNTQDSIQSLSLWILHHKAHSTKIVNVWMKVLKKAKIGHRLTLFYLANDVIQNGKRKGATQFGAAFAEVLREAILLLKDDKIKGNIERVLKIWEERSVFTSETISDLLDILSSAKICKDTSLKILAEFKPENVADLVQKVQALESETASKLAALNSSKLEAATSEVLTQLKDRSHGQKFSKEFDAATLCLEEYIKVLESENQSRQEAIEVLEQAGIYYDTQRGEARVVANAYKNFAARVKTQKKKLEDHMTTLPSPVPSPCPDAPSPSNSEGLDLSPILEAPDASPPSPIGTPDELKSPSASQMDKDSVGGAINSFIPQGPGMMTSWLDSFTATAPATPASEAGSLESRLLNFMQKIPGTPSKASNQSAKAAGVGSFTEPKNLLSSEDSRGGTPVKDENSGQGTPVLDEDTPTSPQHVLSKLMSLTKGGKDLSDELLKKFSPITGFGSPLVGGDQSFKSNDDRTSLNEIANKNGFDLLLEKDSSNWKTTNTRDPDDGISKSELNQSFSSPYQPGDTDWRNHQRDTPRAETSSEEQSKTYSSVFQTGDTDWRNHKRDTPHTGTSSEEQSKTYPSPFQQGDTDWRKRQEDTSRVEKSIEEQSKDFSSPYQPTDSDSSKDLNKSFSSPYQLTDSDILDQPPWNTTATFQVSLNRSYKESSEVMGTSESRDIKPSSFHEPLQPPPKPLFPGFDIFNSPPSLSTANSKGPDVPSTNKSASQPVTQSRQDPRLNSQNYTSKGTTEAVDGDRKNQVKHEADDTELMDMDLGNSDSEAENVVDDAVTKPPLSDSNEPTETDRDERQSTFQLETEKDSMSSAGDTDLRGHLSEKSNYSEPSTPQNVMEDPKPSTSEPNDHSGFSQDSTREDTKPVLKPSDHFAFSPNGPPESTRTPPSTSDRFQFSPDRPREEQQPPLSRSSDGFPFSEDRPPPTREDPKRQSDYFPFSPDGPRSKYNPEINLINHPNHERMMHPDTGLAKPMNRDRDMHLVPSPMRGFPSMRMEEVERWRTGAWNAPQEPPPWYALPRRFEDYEFNGRGAPFYDEFGPPPKRFQLPPPHFGRRGYYSPRH